MRSLLFGLAIIVLPLTDLTPAVAHKINHYRSTQSSYSACVCHWGYDTDNSGNIARSCGPTARDAPWLVVLAGVSPLSMQRR
jgi:hypothetical protein